jgi:hypothetical protein
VDLGLLFWREGDTPGTGVVLWLIWGMLLDFAVLHDTLKCEERAWRASRGAVTGTLGGWF